MDERYGTGDSVLDLKLGRCVNLYIVLSDRTNYCFRRQFQFFSTDFVLILRIEHCIVWNGGMVKDLG